MAPQSTRHSGFSRRAQYTTFFAYVAGVLGTLAGAALLGISIYHPAAFAGLRSAASDATAPAGSVAAGTRSASVGLFETVAGYIAAGHQNAQLRREAEVARVRLVEAQAIAEENRRLKALLGLRNDEHAPVAMGRLIASTSSSTRRFAMISAGSDDGVAVGMPVRSPLGLIGRVLETGSSTSRVLLITDTESVVPVRRARDGVPAFATGRGDGTLQLRLINLGINPLKKGDTFVTSGSGGLYRPGTAIAVVSAVTSDGAIARVLSDPAGTDYVAVERVWAPEAQAVAGSASDTSASSAPGASTR